MIGGLFLLSCTSYVAYPAVIEDALGELVPYITENTTNRVVEPRWTALTLMSG